MKRLAVAGLLTLATVLLTPATSEGVATTLPATTLPATIPQRWFPVRLNVEGGTLTNTMTDADFVGEVGAVKEYWREQSDGHLAIDVQPLRSYNSTATTLARGCGLGQDFAAVRDEAAAVAGATRTNDLLILLVPYDCRIGGGSLGGGSSDAFDAGLTSGGIAVVAWGNRDIISHEVGHTYGLGHAPLGPCVGLVCQAEYGNRYELMGSGMHQAPALGGAFREKLGLTSAAEVDRFSYDPAQPFVRYTSLMGRASTSGRRSFVLADPDTGQSLWLEYRDGGGRDSAALYAKSYVSGDLTFSPGLVVTSGPTSFALLPSGGRPMTQVGQTWTNESGTLRATLTSTDPIAYVTLTYTPGPAFDSGQLTLVGSRANETVMSKVSQSPATSSRDYRWYIDGTLVSTQPNLGATVDMIAKSAQLQVTSWAPGRRPQVLSADTVITPAQFFTDTTPFLTVAGDPVVAGTLTASATPVNIRNGRGELLTPNVTFQWYRSYPNGPIPGATSASYQPVAQDVGNQLVVRQTWSLPGYTSRELLGSSNNQVRSAGPIVPGSVGPPGAGGGVATTIPTQSAWMGRYPAVLGIGRVGKTLQADPGGWRPGTTYTIKWYVGRRLVATAPGTRLGVKKAWRGKAIRIEVTGALVGYRTETKRSRGLRVSR